jgi:hypothetical protein
MANKTDLVPTEKAPQGIILNQLTVNRVIRQLLDMGKWKTALQSADMDRWTLLYDLYEEILTDGRLWDAIERRIRAVTSSDLTFQMEDGTEVQEIIDLIDTDDFEYLLHEIMVAIFQRVSLLQLDFSNGMQVFSVPRKHIRPLTKTVAIMQNDIDGTIAYESLQNIVEVLDKKDKYGLLLRAAPYVIMMRGGIADWAQMVELFGMPQRIGKYSIYDQEARKQLEQAFEQQGAAASMVVPKETDVLMADNGRSTNSSIYKDFMAELKEALLVTVLSNTMTTLNGSSRSQGEVHQDVEDEVNKQDMRFVQRILNKKVKPILEARGFKVHGGAFVFPKALKDLNVDELVSLTDIIEIPAYYVQKKFGIPEAKKTDLIARKAAPPTPVIVDPTKPVYPNKPIPPETKNGQAVSKPLEKKPEVKLSDVEITGFWKGFFNFFAVARTPRSRASLTLADKLPNSTELGISIDALFKQALNDIYKQYEINPDDMPLVDQSLFEISNAAYQYAINKEFGIGDSNSSVSSDFALKNESFITEFKANASVFAAFKNHQQTNDLVTLLTDENGDLRSFDNFRKLSAGINADYNETWLKTEYNQAVRSARMAAKVKSYMETADLYPNMEYMETTAATPREEHENWVGTILPINDPWWDDHMPPSAWGCECSVRNTDAPASAPPDDTVAIDPVFANNSAKTAEIVNMAEHPYVKSVDPEMQQAIKDLAAQLFKG